MELDRTAQVIVVLFSLPIAVVLHEVMHGLVAFWLGDDTAQRAGRLTLNPINHIDPFATILLPLLLAASGLPAFGAAKPVPFNPARVKGDEYGAALVGLAGPMTNLILAMIAGFWTRFVIGLDGGVVADVLVIFTILNLAFFVFNLIPFPPLDGSRILFAFAPDFLRDLMRSIERTGLMGFALFFFVVFPVLAPFISFMIDNIGSLILGIDSLTDLL